MKLKFDGQGRLLPYDLNYINHEQLYPNLVDSFKCGVRDALLIVYQALLSNLADHLKNPLIVIVYGGFTRKKTPKDIDIVLYVSPEDYVNLHDSDYYHELNNWAYQHGIDIYDILPYTLGVSSVNYHKFKEQLEGFKDEHLCNDGNGEKAGALVIAYAQGENLDASIILEQFIKRTTEAMNII